jgi:hypothetical protein
MKSWVGQYCTVEQVAETVPMLVYHTVLETLFAFLVSMIHSDLTAISAQIMLREVHQ